MSTIKPSPLDVNALLAFHRAAFGDARMEADEDNDNAPDRDHERPTPADLGDPGKKALAAERAAKREAEKKANEAAARAAELEAKIAEFERAKMNDQERIAAERDDWRKKFEETQAALAARELDVLRRDVAAEKGLPPGMARRLQGSTREQLEADADDLWSQFAASNTAVTAPKAPPVPRPDPSAGATGRGGRPASVAEAMRNIRAAQTPPATPLT